MTRLIDAGEMLKRLESWNTDDEMDKALYNFTLSRIIEQPTVDAEPVRHGKWIYGNDFHWYTASCNECGYQRRTDIKADRWNQWNYCPNCGAKMDAEQEKQNDRNRNMARP